MRRVLTKVIVAAAVLAVMTVLTSSAQARWQALADYPGVLDMAVCKDGMRLQVIARDLASIEVGAKLQDGTVVATPASYDLVPVDPFRIPSYTSSTEDANRNRFFVVKWNQQLGPGTIVVASYRYGEGEPEEQRYLVTDCELPKLYLDKFDRANGGLKAPWLGDMGNYEIQNNQLRVKNGFGGGALYWYAYAYPANEVSIKFVKVDRSGGEQGVLLAVQGDIPDYTLGAIKVVYDPGAGEVRIEAYRPARDPVVLLRKPAVFNDGDTLGAAIVYEPRGNPRTDPSDTYSPLTIMVSKKSPSIQGNRTVLLGVVKPEEVAPEVEQFFYGKGGRIGLWFENAPQAVVDQFVMAINPP